VRDLRDLLPWRHVGVILLTSNVPPRVDDVDQWTGRLVADTGAPW